MYDLDGVIFNLDEVTYMEKRRWQNNWVLEIHIHGGYIVQFYNDKDYLDKEFNNILESVKNLGKEISEMTYVGARFEVVEDESILSKE